MLFPVLCQINPDKLAQKDSVFHAKTVETFRTLFTMDADDAFALIVRTTIEVVLKILLALLVYYVGRWLIRRFVRFIMRLADHRHVELSVQHFMRRIVQVILFIFLALIIVGVLGLNTASFVAIFASAGLAIGMALSGTLQNFAGGVMIMVLKPYRIGDYIESLGNAGTVSDINLFNTVLNTPDNKTIYVPNSSISSGIIHNYSQQVRRRIDFPVTISYGDSYPAAREVLLRFAAEDKRVLKDPAPIAVVDSLGDSAVNLILRVWVPSGDFWDATFDLNARIYNELPAAAGIEFPFPQVQVHFDPEKAADPAVPGHAGAPQVPGDSRAAEMPRAAKAADASSGTGTAGTTETAEAGTVPGLSSGTGSGSGTGTAGSSAIPDAPSVPGNPASAPGLTDKGR